jgi:uncharacterized membrane protein YbhN (UPF0104 family)
VRAAPGWRGWSLRLLASALVLGVLVTLLDKADLAHRLAEFWRASPLVWTGALLLFLLLHAGGAVKWRLFLSLAGAKVPLRSALRFYGAGLFANLCLPTMIGGDVVRAGLAIAGTKEKEAVLLGSVADRLADLVALCGLAAAGSLLSPSARDALSARGISETTILATFLGLLAAGVVGLTLLLLAFPRGKLATVDRLRDAVRALRVRPGTALGGFALCLGLQSGFVLLNAWIGSAMGLPLDTAAWFLVVPLAKIAAMVPVSLGGIGVREVAISALMAPLGIARELAVAQSLVWQSVLVSGSLLAGAISAATKERARGV